MDCAVHIHPAEASLDRSEEKPTAGAPVWCLFVEEGMHLCRRLCHDAVSAGDLYVPAGRSCSRAKWKNSSRPCLQLCTGSPFGFLWMRTGHSEREKTSKRVYSIFWLLNVLVCRNWPNILGILDILGIL